MYINAWEPTKSKRRRRTNVPREPMEVFFSYARDYLQTGIDPIPDLGRPKMYGDSSLFFPYSTCKHTTHHCRSAFTATDYQSIGIEKSLQYSNLPTSRIAHLHRFFTTCWGDIYFFSSTLFQPTIFSSNNIFSSKRSFSIFHRYPVAVYPPDLAWQATVKIFWITHPTFHKKQQLTVVPTGVHVPIYQQNTVFP